jgi:3-hydroxyisobutyrate dehydrogenase-like beta-hydroxyacid dehydrogenase
MNGASKFAQKIIEERIGFVGHGRMGIAMAPSSRSGQGYVATRRCSATRMPPRAASSLIIAAGTPADVGMWR